MSITPAYFINQPSGILEENLTTQLLRQSEAPAYHQSLPGYVPTPLVRLQHLARHCGVAEVWVKDESHRLGLSAFKALGASYAVQELVKQDQKIHTFCTATDGNHGRAVAWAAQLQGKKAVVFVPANTVESRIAAIKAYGATVIVTEKNYDETCAIAARYASDHQCTLVQDTAWPDYEYIPALIMAGYLTHFKEMEDTLHTAMTAQVDIVFLQAGVGSWAAAAAWYYQNRYQQQMPVLVIAEPENAAGIFESFQQNHLSLPAVSRYTMMAGLNCGIPSSTAWPILKNTVHSAMCLQEAAAATAMRQLYHPLPGDQRIEAGESGAAGVAAFLELIHNPAFAALKQKIGIHPQSRILCYNTEGATDPENFDRIVNAAAAMPVNQ